MQEVTNKGEANEKERARREKKYIYLAFYHFLLNGREMRRLRRGDRREAEEGEGEEEVKTERERRRKKQEENIHLSAFFFFFIFTLMEEKEECKKR